MPSTRNGKHSDLHQGPADDTGVGRFGLITEFGLAFLKKQRKLISLISRHPIHSEKAAPTPKTACLFEEGRTYSLEHLLAPNILQPAVQVLDPLHQICHLPLILALDLARLANCHIQGNSNSAGRRTGEPPTGSSVRLWCKADLVVSWVGSGEGESAGVGVALVDDAVIIVEDFVDRDEHLHRLVGGICARVGSLIDNFA